VLKQPGLALSVLWGISLRPRFRERLYLAVIAVNGCRYCTYFHTRSALHSGLSRDDVNRLLTGVIDHVPMDEAKALLYAQHWADNKGQPDAQARADLIQAYGAKQARAIEMALLLIQIGSLCGNSFDYFLFRLSRGRWGLTKREPS
jgi:AhpD family alkylhydroperoxidase